MSSAPVAGQGDTSHLVLPLPETAQWHAPASWRCIDFISDLHLAENTPRSVEAWKHYMASTCADGVCILGDLVEVWLGDDARHEGFEAEFFEALHEAARQRWVGIMVGNRDFLMGQELFDACGAHALPDPTVMHAFGSCALITHGDALCLADTRYQAFRAQVRSQPWQQQFLAQPLAARREFARKARQASQSHQRDGHDSMAENWADVDPPSAAHWLSASGAATLIHGHTHRAGDYPLPDGRLRRVLSDWDADHAPVRAQVLRWSAHGWSRQTPTQSCTTAA